MTQIHSFLFPPGDIFNRSHQARVGIPGIPSVLFNLSGNYTLALYLPRKRPENTFVNYTIFLSIKRQREMQAAS